VDCARHHDLVDNLTVHVLNSQRDSYSSTAALQFVRDDLSAGRNGLNAGRFRIAKVTPFPIPLEAGALVDVSVARGIIRESLR